MSRPNTYEEKIFSPARAILSKNTSSFSEWLSVLEILASLSGGFDINEYWAIVGCQVFTNTLLLKTAQALKAELKRIDVPISIGISILAREPIQESRQKETGAFYTDFRLAQILAHKTQSILKRDSDVADLASGTGILLSAVCEIYKGKEGDNLADWVSNHVYAYDLSSVAIRGVMAALSSYLNKSAQVEKLASHLKVQDSLLSEMPEFDVVVGNPPWGRIKLSQYAFAKRRNASLTYGAKCDLRNAEAFGKERKRIQDYANQIKSEYSLLDGAEPDMYMAFLHAGFEHLKVDGFIAILIPAGFIRAQGTASFRRHMFENVVHTDIALFDNKARFFSIDTRFKFLMFSGKKSERDKKGNWSITFSHKTCKDRIIQQGERLTYKASELMTIRPDLSIPECRTIIEKNLFAKISKNGMPMSCRFADISIVRELDMSLDKPKFRRSESADALPIIEGRMVQPFRLGAKAYVSGEGRRATWLPSCEKLKPQFYIPSGDLSETVRRRTQVLRAGFCDIAGQTNERGMMSALISSNVVCGNKVPTVMIDDGMNRNAILYWIGVTNSFVFDWMLRRVLTTTVNFFLLNGLPFPKGELDDDHSKAIIEATDQLCAMGKEYYYDNATMSDLRATVDAEVAMAYGLCGKDMELVMADFPIIDRGQPAIDGELHSTITRDLILSRIGTQTSRSRAKKRVQSAVEMGACAYMLYEMRFLAKAKEVES